jgi:RNA polymerase sigma factor (TIGR02999 family)
VNDLTQVLKAVEQGDPKAAGELLPLVYEELRRLATHRMGKEAAGHTLQPTALVHEAWLRLVGHAGEPRFANRAHFFGAAAEAMRRILIDRARRKQAAKHGGGQDHLDIQEVEIAMEQSDDQLLALNDALEKLAATDKVKADLVKLRYFAGLKINEAAAVLGISAPTAKRYWTFARAWLYQEIQSGSAKKTP